MLGTPAPDYAAVFGTILRRLRTDAGLSQEALGFEAELQRNYISLLELGRYQPTITSLFKLARALKTTPAALVAEVEREASTQHPRRRR